MSAQPHTKTTMPWRPLSLLELEELAARLGHQPVTRIVVSAYVDPEGVHQVPRYYDRRRCAEVETWVLGSSAWKRLLAETAIAYQRLDDDALVFLPSASSDLASGVPVEFNPPSWRPE